MHLPKLALAIVCAAAGSHAAGQAVPTASVRLIPSVFAGASSVETGLHSGRNIALTAGFDLAFPAGRRLEPALEYRGAFAVDKGSFDSQENELAGVRLAARFSRLHPYANLLFGRGEIHYATPAQVPEKPVFYTVSSSNVLSPGAGVDVDLGNHFAVRVDAQLQRYRTPVVASGQIYAEAVTLGIRYDFHFGLHGR